MFLVHYRAGDPIRFLLILVTRLAHREFQLRPGTRRSTAGATSLRTFVIGFGLDFIRVLLHHMSQFMSKQLTPAGTTRVVFSLPKVNVPSGGKRLGAQRTIQAVGANNGVNPPTAELGVH